MALLITSWLFAPFIYNPHQFRYQQYMDDVRCWFAFFVPNRSKNWIQWFEKCQLRLDTGGRVPVDISLFFLCFFLLTWYELLSSKVEAFANVYSETSRPSNLRNLAFLPPIFGSMALCILILAMERIVAGISFAIQWLKLRTSSSDGTPDVECPGATDLQSGRPQWRVIQTPLILVSLGVVVAVIAESVIALHNFAWVEWRGAFIAGIVFKFALLSTILHLSEEVLRSPRFQRVACLCHFLKLFVYAHRMARDLLTSSLILLALSPAVLLDSLNSCCCIGFSVHHLLIYRDPGRPAREHLEGLRWNQGRTQMWHTGISFWHTTEKSDMDSSEKADMAEKGKSVKAAKSARMMNDEMCTIC